MRIVQRSFRAETGATIVTYVQDRRLDAAAILLRTTDLSVTEIALSTGFGSASYFARLFARRYGTFTHAVPPGRLVRIGRNSVVIEIDASAACGLLSSPNVKRRTPTGDPMNRTDIDIVTFDCYGTLIDWDGGLATFLAQLALQVGDTDAPNGRVLRERWEAIQFDMIQGTYMKYDQALAESLRLWAPNAVTAGTPSGARPWAGQCAPGSPSPTPARH